MPQKKPTKAGKVPAASRRAAEGFTAEEHAAMKARVRELEAAGGGGGERDVLAAIAKIEDAGNRAMAERLHAIIKTTAPQLLPKTWYGMPAYANAEGKVVCFFRPAEKFKERYATFGFNTAARLDEGNMWPVVFALLKLTAAGEKRIAALVKQAVRG